MFHHASSRSRSKKKTKESEDKDHGVDDNNNNADDADDHQKKLQELICYLNPATWESTVATNREFDEVQDILEVI